MVSGGSEVQAGSLWAQIRVSGGRLSRGSCLCSFSGPSFPSPTSEPAAATLGLLGPTSPRKDLAALAP